MPLSFGSLIAFKVNIISTKNCLGRRHDVFFPSKCLQRDTASLGKFKNIVFNV